jgi:hypothetical protein
MAAGTEQAALLERQWQVAVADGAEEHGSSVAEVGGGEAFGCARVFLYRTSRVIKPTYIEYIET